MFSIIDKLQEIRAEVAAERGGIVLLALFEREGAEGKWDIIFSADWIARSEDERPALRYLIQKLRPKLTSAELVAVSRVIVLQPSERLVEFVLALLRTQGPYHLTPFSFNGMVITQAVIIAPDVDDSLQLKGWNAEAYLKQTSEDLEAIANSYRAIPLKPLMPRGRHSSHK